MRWDQIGEYVERLSSWVIAQLQHELYDLEPTDAGAKRVADLFARLRELSEFAGVRRALPSAERRTY